MQRFDAIFKLIFSDKHIFFEFLQIFLPDLINKHGITENDLTIEKTEFMSSDLKMKRSDMLYRIRSKEYEAYVYVLLEHQARKDYLMPLRMLGYMVRIWEYHVRRQGDRAKRKTYKLPQIIPIVFYDGEGRWTVEKDISEKVRILEGFERYVPRFEYMVVDMNEINLDRLIEMKNALVGLMYIDAMGGKDIVEVLKKVKEVFYDLKEDERELMRRYMKSMFIAMLGEKGKELEGIEEVEEMFVGIKRGFEKAIKEAKDEGLLEARKEDIFRVLRKRFGESAKRIIDRINEITDLEKLDELFDRSLEVKDLEEFEKFLR